MSHKRKNKSSWAGDKSTNQKWFDANVARQKRRKKLAKDSRKRNRG